MRKATMKSQETKLRNLIRKEVRSALHETSRPKKRSLVSMIFEDASPDIQAAYKGGPAAVRALANSAKDKEDLKTSLQGDFDQEKSDDVVEIGGGSKSVGSLLPTQSEIDLVKSIGWPLGDVKTLEKMITTGTSTAPGTITISGNLVIDGHHRWSGIWSVSGPSGTVAVDDLKLPGGSTAQQLAAAQLAIAAYKPADSTQPAAAEPIELNILGKSPEAIEKDILGAEGQKDPKAPGAILNPKYLEGCANSETVADWAGFNVGDDIETVKSAVVKKVASNLATLPKNDEAPARADMPQFDHDDIGGKKAKADIMKGLKSGEFNVAPPFGPEGGGEGKKKQESRFTSGTVMVERWQKLAGIIK